MHTISWHIALHMPETLAGSTRNVIDKKKEEIDRALCVQRNPHPHQGEIWVESRQTKLAEATPLS